MNVINSFNCLQINHNHTVTTMDLDKLPVSTYRVQTVDKKAIEKDRKDWWDKFFTKVISLTKQTFNGMLVTFKLSVRGSRTGMLGRGRNPRD